MLLVGEDCTGNSAMNRLWNVRTELACVDSIATTKRFGRSVETIAREATVERVTERVQSASFVHLACHGLQHRTNALESGFYLNDDKLTISKLMELSSIVLGSRTSPPARRPRETQSSQIKSCILLQRCCSPASSMWSQRCGAPSSRTSH
jgi:CHAT domain-containing protein